MKTLICRHSTSGDPGLLIPALNRCSLDYQYFDSSCMARPAAGDFESLVILGGSQSANDPDEWVQTEQRLIEESIHHQKPVLGICLGAQVLARSLGAEVTRNPVPEIGWHRVFPAEAAQSDPVLSGMPASHFFHWHAETFALPAGAVLLASSELCRNQAFRYGERVWGIQFHPEVTPAIIRSWLKEDADCDQPETNGAIDADAHYAEAERSGLRILEAWCGIVARGKP